VRVVFVFDLFLYLWLYKYGLEPFFVYHQPRKAMPATVRAGSGTARRASHTNDMATISDHTMCFVDLFTTSITEKERKRRLRILKTTYHLTEIEARRLGATHSKIDGPGVVNCFLRERLKDRKACFDEYLGKCHRRFQS